VIKTIWGAIKSTFFIVPPHDIDPRHKRHGLSPAHS
jgi:hypothetical protein